jgi:hypothetical protein
MQGAVGSHGFSMQGERPVESHKKRSGAVYVDIMYWQNVTKCWELSEGRNDVHSEQRSGGASLISADLLQKTEGEIQVNQHSTIRELHHLIPLS